MRSYVSPIGYDTRRVTRPVVNTGISEGDTVHLLRPEQETDTERATQAVADTKQLLQEIEPTATCKVTRIQTSSMKETVQDCLQLLGNIPSNNEVIISLGGGARDILLPLVISSIVAEEKVDRTLFFSDLDSSVQEWMLPRLTAQIPNRTLGTFEQIIDSEKWVSLSKVASTTNQSKSTVIRHVQNLEDVGVVESKTKGKVKHVRTSFSGDLVWRSIKNST